MGAGAAAYGQPTGWWTLATHPPTPPLCLLQGYNFDLTPPYYTYYYTVPDGLNCDGIHYRCIVQW